MNLKAVAKRPATAKPATRKPTGTASRKERARAHASGGDEQLSREVLQVIFNMLVVLPVGACITIMMMML